MFFISFSFGILFLSSWNMKCFFISVIFRADCNEIESNIVKSKNVSHLQKSKRKKEIIRTQSEKIVETDMDLWY